MKTHLHMTDWITTRIETDGTTTHVVPMNQRALEAFLKEFEIVAEEAGPHSIDYHVKRRSLCKNCADWFEGICDNEEAEINLNSEALKRYGTVEGVAAIRSTGPYYTCFFYRNKPRSDQYEFRKTCIPKTTRVFKREGE